MSWDASESDIKRAYRRLALQCHPDAHPDDPTAASRFAGVAEAYAVVGDAQLRAAYDAGLGRRATPPAASSRSGASNADEGLGGILDGLFGARDRRTRPGRDRKYSLAVTFAEMARGVSKTLVLPRDVPCPTCQGRAFEPGTAPTVCQPCDGSGTLVTRGALRSSVHECAVCAGRGYVCPHPCTVCAGRGEVGDKQRVSVQVPAGVKDGKTLVLRGLGEVGRNGGRPGDCVVHVTVEEHPLLRRDGPLNVRLDRPLSVLTAVLGGKLEVPTPTGSATLTLPSGAKDGLVLRMRGFGVTDPKTGQTGDQLVTIHFELPSSLDAAQVAALERVAADLLASPGVFPETATFERTLEQLGDSHGND